MTAPKSPRRKQVKDLIPLRKSKTADGGKNNSPNANGRNNLQSSTPGFLESRVYCNSPKNYQQPQHKSMKLTEGFLCDDGLKLKLQAISKKQNERNKEEKFCTKPSIICEISRLCDTFPGFPKSMMESLIARYDGNCDSVFKFLLNRDWQPNLKGSFFKDECDEHFTCPYYFGYAPPKREISRLLKPCGSGNFITFYRIVGDNQFKYFVCYKRGTEILEKAIKLPYIPDVLRNTLGLTKGMRCTYARDKSFIPLYI